jgi:catechol 2,3-dioxygenase-like lactoylglutathione lyase family enzyme
VINKVHHIGISVTDLKESIYFYKSNGFELESEFELESPKSKCAFMTKAGSAGIELFDFSDPNNSGATSIKNHVAYESTNIESDFSKLIEVGFTVSIPITPGNFVKRFAHLIDKSGNTIELVET